MNAIKFLPALALCLSIACNSIGNTVTGNTKQSTPIPPEKVLAAWDGMTNMVVESTKKMPAEHFSFSPVEPLATYGGLVSHTTGANFLFAPTVKLEAPERGEFDTNDKQAVIKNLEESFAFIRGGIEALSANDLNEEIEWFGSKMSRLNAILTMTDHLQREYGKNITYLRLKGIAPAQSTGW